MFHITPRLKFMKLFSDNRPRAVAEIAGSAENLMTPPAGNTGEKIGSGVVKFIESL